MPSILCYHKIERRLELGVTRISPRRFARQIERLARAGYATITVDQLIASGRGERAVGERDIAIVFDDAYRGLREHAFPVLEAHGFRGICSVITDYAGRLNRWDVAYGGRRFAHLAWRDMRRWQEREVIEFVSHTATHPRLTWLDDAGVASELVRSRQAVQRELGQAPRAVSYPFGAAGERERHLAREAGYEAGLQIAGRRSGDPFAIPTFPVYLWAPPMPALGRLRAIEWAGAVAANRWSIGTTLIQNATKRRVHATETVASLDESALIHE